MNVNIQLSPEDLESIRGIIREEIAKSKEPKAEKFFTREEAAQLLKITKPTLHSWTAKGTIRATKLNGRVLYSDREIQRLMNQ